MDTKMSTRYVKGVLFINTKNRMGYLFFQKCYKRGQGVGLQGGAFLNMPYRAWYLTNEAKKLLVAQTKWHKRGE